MEEAGLSLRITVAGKTRSVGGTDVTVGRGTTCDVVVDDPLVSRTHLAIRANDRGWEMEDLGSRNGTFANGQRIGVLEIGTEGVSVHLGGPDGLILTVVPDGTDGPADLERGSRAPRHAAHRDATDPTTQVRVTSPGPESVVTIGRAPDNTFVLGDDLLVSRHHAEVVLGADGAHLRDLGSHNGTFVNGQQVSKADIKPGDLVGVGQHDFRLTPGGLEVWTRPSDIRFAAAGLSVKGPSGTLLLDSVDLAVGANGFLAVVGPSGAGKSTLLNALTGTRPADAGTVSYEGRNLYAEYDDLRSRLGIVPQDDILHVQLTVRQALMYSAELRFPPEVSKGERQRRVDEVMAELGLTQRSDVRISKLSGGQRKRVSVALELLTKPSLLFLDEPTSGLDPGFERSVMQLLRDLADGGRTVVVVTHSVASLHLTDAVLVMAPGGRPAFFGPAYAAPAFFGQQDFQGIFQLLADEGGEDWASKFAGSPERARFLPSLDTAAEPAEADVVAPPGPPRARSSFRQFATLTRRYLSLLRSDRVALLILLGQAVVAGLLQFVVLPRGELAPPTHGSLRIFSSAAAVLLNPIQIVTALGLANGVTVLVREREVFRRERAVGLSIPAYLLSKVVVLSVIAVVQAAILVAFTTFHEGGPTGALALGRPFIELTAVLALTGIAAIALGLIVSSLASTENMAMTIMPIVLVVENVLSMGGLSPDSLAKPVLNQAQYVASAQWGFAAAAATADLNRLEGLSSVLKDLKVVNTSTVENLATHPIKIEGERRYRHLRAIWWEDMGALLAIAVTALLATGLGLTRLDPALVR
ncbi:MAG TPA: FHA domain-containing protein [Acidimicrobiales bacterium]|nr:FHA domain-containing protein [Acidimicrobiales bacterium]